MHTPVFHSLSRAEQLGTAAALAALLAGCAATTPTPKVPEASALSPVAATAAVPPVDAAEPASEPTAEHQPIPDPAVSTEVRRELLLDDGVPAEGIDVATHEGVVTLSGTVDDVLAKKRAVRLARGIRGVVAVVDDVVVPRSKESDKALAGDVRAAIASDPATAGYDIDVHVHNGKVTLRGLVHSWAEKSLAVDAASRVDGVTGVENQLAIEYKVDRSDSHIRQDIVERLQNDMRVDSELIGVEVKGGAVTLTGQVGSAAERALAYADAWVAGVTSVDNSGLEVRWWARDQMRKHNTPIPTPAKLDKALDAAFRWDPRVTPGEIKPHVVGGVATLEGVVGSLAAKRAAGDDARNTDGIWRVDNYVQVRPPKHVSDQQLAENVRDRLQKNPYVDSDDIRVTAHHGRVSLGGRVDNRFQQKQATREAEHERGVVAVNNDLHVGKQKARERPDWQLEQDIESGLRWDPYVDAGAVHVEVHDGVATLTGTVGNEQAYHAAADEARAAGPRRVVNDLDVVSGPAFLKQ